MPLRKPPPDLQVLAINTICNEIIEPCWQSVYEIVLRVVRGETRMEECIDFIHDLAQLFRQYLEQLPHTLLRSMIPDVIDMVDDIYFTYQTYVNIEMHAEMLKAFLPSILPSQLQECDLRFLRSHYTIDGVLFNLHTMSGLTYLKLPNEVGLVQPFRELMLEQIPHLTRLQVLTCIRNCSDVIIEALSQSCPRMKRLQVNHSTDVTDESVQHLLKMKELTALDISSTNITNNGYKTILTQMPKIINVSWQEDIENDIAGENDRFERIEYFSGKVREDGTLPRAFPNAKSLMLFKSSRTPMLSSTKIENLELSEFIYTTNTLYNTLSNIGQRLSYLSLHRVEGLHIPIVVDNCHNIKWMSIRTTKFSTFEMNDINTNSPHFQNLVTLRLMTNSRDEMFLKILKHYINLEVLDATLVPAFQDQYFNYIFDPDHGGNTVFKKIKTIILQFCGHLSLSTAELLRNKCPLLTTLGLVRTWSHVNIGAINNLLEEIRTNNLNLHLPEISEVDKTRRLAEESIYKLY